MAFDICPANRVLNMLAAENGKEYDEGGKMAASGNASQELLQELSRLPYYAQPYPKSLANQFGTAVVYPLIKTYQLSVHDALNTYVAHIVQQVKWSITQVLPLVKEEEQPLSLLVTGGGALNEYLTGRLSQELVELNIRTVIPDRTLIEYKEAMIMALIAVLRWREEYNVLSTVTGARRNTIGGALWIGTEA